MVQRRIDLHAKLVQVLQAPNVYFQPPESIKMTYPAIRYELNNVIIRHADNRPYNAKDRYSVIIISRDPDCDVRFRLQELPTVSFDRHYVSDGLHHWAYSLYY